MSCCLRSTRHSPLRCTAGLRLRTALMFRPLSNSVRLVQLSVATLYAQIRSSTSLFELKPPNTYTMGCPAALVALPTPTPPRSTPGSAALAVQLLGVSAKAVGANDWSLAVPPGVGHCSPHRRQVPVS